MSQQYKDASSLLIRHSTSESQLNFGASGRNPVSGPSTFDASTSAPNLPADGREDLEMVDESGDRRYQEPLDHEALRRQWIDAGRPSCRMDGCPNRAHPPPCDPARRDRLRAERAAAKAAKKAAKSSVNSEALPAPEARKRKASEEAEVPAAKRPQPVNTGLSNSEIAAFSNALTLATSDDPRLRQFASQAARTMAEILSSPAPQRGGSSHGRSRGNGNGDAAGRRRANVRQPRGDRGQGRGALGRGASN